jgi:sec-independent protein translocase protein TatA
VGIESPVHLLFLGAVALLVLGPKRLPELARALGKGIRELRESIDVAGARDDAPGTHHDPPGTPGDRDPPAP